LTFRWHKYSGEPPASFRYNDLSALHKSLHRHAILLSGERNMLFFLKRALWLLVCLVIGLPASAQQLQQQLIKSGNTSTETTDPLGRDTPSGTLYGFLQAAQSGNYSTAAQYLQMSAAKRQALGEEYAAKLKVVIDRAFSGNLRRISNQPEGTPQEGMPLDRQLVGVLASGDVEANLVLIRVSQAGGGQTWLISSETLARVPELYDQATVHQVEAHLPQILVRHQFLGLPWWQWIGILLAVPVAAALGWLAVGIVKLPRYFWARYRKEPLITTWSTVWKPLWLVLAAAIHGVLVSYLSMPVLQRHRYQQAAGVVLVVAFSWLLWRVLRELLQRVRQRALISGRRGTGSLVLLGERLLKALIVVLAIFTVLGTLGFNLTTALAGLGIGGLAIAFAAQKTLENLFGGVSVLGDEVIRVGDVCRFGDSAGTVEDIGLRSTQVRTDSRTVLSIPNGSLATMNVENLSRRDKILFNTKLGLRYETSPDQLRYVLAQIRRLLYEHSKVETSGARIRFIGFDQSALSLELFCYVLTRDYGEFLAVREDLLLRIMEVVNASGTRLAVPSNTLYLGRDSGLDKEKTESATRQVQEWREANRLPFPDFAPADISELNNSLPYPQSDSAVADGK
jgi:MscS family membrane protein